IHAEKPGLVIGKSGETLNTIKEKTFWTPDIKRAPVIDSVLVKSVRRMLHEEVDYRKKFLNNIGKKIYVKDASDVEWVRLTCLGSFREVGRSCMLLQTPESRVLLDCGVSVSSFVKPFPYLSAPEFHIQDLDAVILSHAHLDHCLHPETLVQLSDGSIKKITEVETGEETPAIDFKYSMKMHRMPSIQRGGIKSPDKIYEVRTSTKRIKATGNHPLFILEGGEIKIRHVEKIKPGDFVATPRSIEIEGSEQELPRFKGMPEKMTENLAQLLGYISGDGHRQGGTICCTDKDLGNIEFYSGISASLDFRPKIKIRERNRLLIHSVNFVKFLEKIGHAMLKKSRERKIPQVICKSPENIVAAFLRGLYDAEGSVKHHSVVLSTSSENIAYGVQMLLLRFAIISHIYDHDNAKSTFGGSPAYQIAISHPASLKIFNEIVGFSDNRKKAKLEKIAETAGKGVSEKVDIIPIKLDYILRAAEEMGLRKIDLRKVGFHYYHYKKHHPSKEALLRLVENLERIAKEKGVKSEELEELAKISRAPVLWDPVKKVTEIDAETDEVYDLTIPGHSNYIANGVFVHNCGLVPYLYEYGYKGPLYCTRPTRDLSVLLQLDYIGICQRENKKAPYSSKAIEQMVKHCVPLEYGEVTDITPDMRITLQNAGHLMGSSSVHIHVGEGLFNLLYTADIKYETTKLFERASTDYHRIEAVIIESTYGGSDNTLPSHQDGEQFLVDEVKKAIQRGGRVLIPSFAVGRGQDVVAILADSDIDVPIYQDGMVWDATAIHTAYPEFMSRAMQMKILHKGKNPFIDPRLRGIGSSKERQEIFNTSEPCVVIATSGMLMGGPALEYLQQFAGNPKNTLLFVGYQAEGSLGRRIQKGWREIQMENGKTLELKMEIATVQGLSGHSDQRQLLAYLSHLRAKPKKIMTNHGDNMNCVDLAKTIHKLFRVETMAPKNLETIRFK
ncbi:MAG: MBL fold metallo-hydrolase, partial [Candidatus Aenigmarchaeota archaeon]|nr:MBL fold metallo-hydrolase [Candidatus Aenigmarchaeota archaeon]